jgi:nucleoside-diphosphate-sugar epimerase
VRHLRADGYEILETDIRPGTGDDYVMADINHPIDLLPAFDWGPDVVFLLSAMVSRVTCEQASGLAVATNLAGVNNVLQLCKRTGARVVFFSTSEVYGPGVGVMDEKIADPQPNNRYGLSKLLGEKLVEYEVRTYGLRAVTLRPFMIYDEHEDLGDHRSAMIRFTGNLAQGVPIEVHRGASRGWMHISDAVRSIEAAARMRDYSVINIGHPDVRPIEELAELIRARLDAPSELLRLVEQPSLMTLEKRPSLERQRDVLGVEPRVSLEEGVELVCTEVGRRLMSRG